MAEGPRPLVGLMAGIAAGLVASAALAAFRSAATPLLDQAAEDSVPHGETAIVADKAKSHSEAHDPRLQYVVGAAIGGVFGVLTEYQPEASAGFGSAYGMATATLLEGRAFDLDAGDVSEAYGVAAPVIFGVVLEGVRALLGGRRG